MEELLNGYFLQVLTFVCINIILAMTIYMTLCTGILSLGNAGLMSFGAYTSAILTAEYNFPMPLGILLGGCTATIVALIIGLPTIRLRGLYLAIATLGFGEVVRVIRESGLPNRTNSMFTEIEGDWDEVMDVVKRATMVLAEKGIRTEVVLKADIRPGYHDMMHGKLQRLEKRLAEDTDAGNNEGERQE